MPRTYLKNISEFCEDEEKIILSHQLEIPKELNAVTEKFAPGVTNSGLSVTQVQNMIQHLFNNLPLEMIQTLFAFLCAIRVAVVSRKVKVDVTEDPANYKLLLQTQVTHVVKDDEVIPIRKFEGSVMDLLSPLEDTAMFTRKLLIVLHEYKLEDHNSH
eukprot:m.340475 g.340475  ORF g.340475 m.340475 type:complete len:158 (+) comp19322_c0_seq1:162-635(+)